MSLPAAPAAPHRRSLGPWLAALAAFLALTLLLVWGLNMRRGLNHDEHQFVASGILIARYGLLPYRDFPYFHVPGLSFLYAAIFRATDYLLLGARTVSILCAWLTLVLIFLAGCRRLAALRPWFRVGIPAAVVLLLLATPSFLHAAGRAWNHDLPVLLTLGAAVGQVAWLKYVSAPGSPPGRWLDWWPGVAGLLLGLAAAARATFVLPAVAFVLSIFFVRSWRTRCAWTAVLLFAGGALVGCLPALLLLGLAPAEFLFGNITYAGLNTAYYQMNGASGDLAMTLGDKLLASAQSVLAQPGNLLLVLLALYTLWRARISRRRPAELLFLLLLLPCFLAGAYAPTPLQEQYLYGLFPLLALIALAALPYDGRPQIAGLLAAAAALVALLLAAPRYAEGLAVALDPAEWFPLKVHARGEYVAGLVGARPVLTLAPIYPLEGKAAIYPEFVTGPLAWRVAPLLSPAERQVQGIVGLDELAADLTAQPPRGILTAVDNSDAAEEAPLVAYAEAHGYVPIPLPDEGVLWTSPIAAWGNPEAPLIRLGAAGLPSSPVAPGGELLVTLHLQAAQPITANLNVLVRLVDPNGGELTRSEGWPWGRATSTWTAGEVWPDGHTFTVPPDAAPGPYRVEVSFYDPATLALVGSPVTVGHVVVGAPAAPAAPLAEFGDGIALLAAEIPEEGWNPGASQALSLTWRAAAPVRSRYTIFLHLIDPDGRPVAQGDQEPWRGAYPTDAWLRGVPATDAYQLQLPPDLSPGSYQLVVGLYDPATGRRLPRLEGGQPAGDSYTLALIPSP